MNRSTSSVLDADKLSKIKQELLLRRLRGEATVAVQTIPRRADQSIAPLSIGQEGQWLLEQIYPGNFVFNIFQTFRFHGVMRIDVLERSLSEVMRRHDVLRTNFKVISGVPMQVVRPPSNVTLQLVDFSSLPDSDKEARFREWAIEEGRRSFDLAKDDLFQVGLARISEKEHCIALNIHHIISDGWSLGVLMREIIGHYRAFEQGKPSPFPELPVQYGDYAAWQRTRLSDETLARQTAFWREHLKTAPVSLDLPVDRVRSGERSYAGGRERVEFDPAMVAKLRELGQSGQATLFMVLLAAYGVVIGRLSGAQDLLIGSPMANRSMKEFEPLIGFFMNSVVFRIDMTSNPTFRVLLERVRKSVFKTFDNQDLPFEKVVEAVGATRAGNNTPLFQVMFSMLPPRADGGSIGLEAEYVPEAIEGAKFDLTLTLTEIEKGPVVGTLEYARDIFDGSSIERMVQQFETILAAVIDNPDRPISDLPLLNEAEYGAVTKTFNQAAHPVPFRPVHTVVSEQAARVPDAIAVIDSHGRLSYAALERRANRLARHLRSLGVNRGDIVGLCLERDSNLIVAFLAVFKVGAAYLPLDIAYPAERLSTMIVEARAPLVITQAKFIDRLQLPAGTNGFCLDTDRAEIAKQSPRPFSASISPEDAAYLLYTSGSTGRPKGIVGTHRAIANRLSWDDTELGPDDLYAQKTTPNFIDAMWEIFTPLMRGRPSLVVSAETARDPIALVEQLSREKATHIVLVPSLLRAMLDVTPDLGARLPLLRHWACSGEALPASLVGDFEAKAPGASLVNIYGTSEFWDATATKAVAITNRAGTRIGPPMANMAVFILDKWLQPMPIGVKGDLYIAGPGLARGYLEQPRLTAERFTPNPFATGERIYRAGDLSQWLADGSVEFVGRGDHQIKLRGFRIELGEIETAFTATGLVRQVSVQLRSDLPRNEPDLVAYYVANPDAKSVSENNEDQEQSGFESALRIALRRKIPDHMVPAYFVELEALPLTPNGKLDRTALPLPRAKRRKLQARTSLNNEIERSLAEIWASVLKTDQFGADDNFFEIGGHSLLLVRVQGSIIDRFGWQIPLVQLFNFPTIRLLADFIVEKNSKFSENVKIGA